MTSHLLYKRLREIFILPTSRRLQQLSSSTLVLSSSIDTNYINRFTDPTFTACIVTLRALANLCSDLLDNCDFRYVLTGKLLSDPLEARFGCYRQMNGANYLLSQSVKQLLDSEKKIRVLNKLADLRMRSITIST